MRWDRERDPIRELVGDPTQRSAAAPTPTPACVCVPEDDAWKNEYEYEKHGERDIHRALAYLPRNSPIDCFVQNFPVAGPDPFGHHPIDAGRTRIDLEALNLPIHQDLAIATMDQMVSQLSACIRVAENGSEGPRNSALHISLRTSGFG